MLKYFFESGALTVIKDRTFDLKAILESGQVFRYKICGRFYEVISGEKRAQIEERGDSYIIVSDDVEYFEKYFDFCRNYDIILKKVQDKALVSSATAFAPGIRILKQEPVETIISFIISANNNIARIKKIIENIAAGLGRDMGGYFAFPALSALASADEDFYFQAGAGYRAPYIKRTAEALLHTDIKALYEMPTEKAHKALVALPGIGPKVADCILLFAFGKTDVFPVDTWIKKVYREHFGDATAKKMRAALIEKYGEYSGFVQQYLFYFKREMNKG
ncbi:MAG TPA: DNA glycosylase [Eubacteriales bacterium]|jgi:N-glycosylase/DNA lyase|nr:DNA glycosylase [Clostridia bacterium]HRR89439.1 DNA glycosylase [Eubacteriales bacterium]HRU84799.1 DNA glycosylase [Eubacteriales bacterium]